MNYMSIEQFKKYIDRIRENDEFYSDLYKLFRKHKKDSNLYADGWILDSVIELLQLHFNDNNDTIYWWLYEDVKKVYYIDDEEIDLTTIEQLYDYLTTSNK